MRLHLIILVLSVAVLSQAKREPKFAPYIDVTRAQDFNLVDLKNQYGVKAFSLAFAIGGTAGCVPMWGGQTNIDDPSIINPIKAFKAAGGDVIVSTGGALGPYLEQSCQTVEDLANAYKKALAATGSTHLDIDIESTVNVDTMNQALAQLQQENALITVSFTLMVQSDDYGVTNELGFNLLKNADKHGVNVDIVNPMTMEFGSSRASWGDAVIAAAEATHKQMKQIWPQKSDQELYSMLGVTPMLGRNFNGKIFEINHAKQLVEWAKQKKIGHLSYWSINRDRGCPGKAVGPGCSSIAQQDHEFSKIFATFDDGVDPSPDPTEIPPVTSQSPPIPTTRKTPDPIDCSIPGKLYPHPTDCNKYIWCFDGQPHEKQCGAGTVWDIQRQVCNYPKDAGRPECM
ncbi:chitinase-like [Oppia nitens]|uniref:chitinase-like n=1 Tax=Oppia nitens TaxID=1686743 RepID=UPI0023DABB85|nr:chitinase-like [Oppia nitens]